MNDIKFSVAMCVYKNDNPEHFQKAINSITNQTIIPDEIVLLIDGPIPNTIEKIINKYRNEEIFKIIKLPQNVGHGNARRICIENCENELIALMDADDISVKNRFEKQIKCFIEDSSLSIVGGNIKEFIGTKDNIVGIREVPQNDSDIKKYLKKRSPFNQVTVMFKASEVISAGGYIDWYNEEDYYLWIRMFQNGSKFKNLKDILVYVRVGKDMYLRRGGWKYFKSEAKLQKYMLKNDIINLKIYIFNISVRFIVQVLMPNSVRSFVFKKFARKKRIE